MFYDHLKIERKWQKFWEEKQTFKSENTSTKEKYYVLDMFPYPSGAGLHVGHPLGYIASDIIARYKRHQGFNVLHPIGYDSFGLPAEQYAIQTGKHPAKTTAENIQRYEQQLKRIGFSFDWSREIKTSDPSYYKWTQWIFIELFNSWYNLDTDKAEHITTLVAHFDKYGTESLRAHQSEVLEFGAQEWRDASEKDRQDILLNYRLAYRAETFVNWCPELGTVLANDEIKDGKSERGGYPVVQKKMMQWSMRITAYSERLLEGLNTLDWPQPLKDAQEYWIGKSIGATVHFDTECEESISVFTTRPDTIFGATFLVIAPEHPLVDRLTLPANAQDVQQYKELTSQKTERDRMSDVKNVTGAFTGTYAIHPFNGTRLPVYISDYVLMGYGTGAVMAVPAHDERDHRFAKKFNLPITNVIATDTDTQFEAYDSKESVCENSDFLNGLTFQEAKNAVIDKLSEKNKGEARVNFRQRDAVFSRQRYWGEPVPVYYKDDIPYTLPISALPLELPEVDKYLPTPDGDPPLGNAELFAWNENLQEIVPIKEVDGINVFPLELSTMPGWAGSSWYFLRYMDPSNDTEAFSKTAVEYWRSVDLYIGGSEHATGHLLYARFWNLFLNDRGYINFTEPFKKVINQGMILGMSAFVFRIEGTNTFVSKGLTEGYSTQRLHVDVSLLKGGGDELDTEAFKKWRPEFQNAEFILEEGRYITEREVEKMSKSKFNVVSPDEICDQYGADCLRMYEMFLGPLEQSKPWNTQGLSGVYGFLKKFYNLFFTGDEFAVSDQPAQKQELKVLHTLIKKINWDLENFSFNTSISQFMIAVNELSKMQCTSREILEPLVVLLSPYAPHLCEELWALLGKDESVDYAPFPLLNESYLEEDDFEYPVSFNGKMRFKLKLPASFTMEEIQDAVFQDDRTQAQTGGKSAKKVIIVPKKIINIVI